MALQARAGGHGTAYASERVGMPLERAGPFQEHYCQENNPEGGVPTADGGFTPSQIPE